MRPALAGALTGVLALILGGCLGGGRFPSQHDTQQAEQPNFPGVRVAGRLDGGGDSIHVEAEARNDGPATYKVSSVCKPPWAESMQGRLGAVYPKGQVGYCHAFGLRDFPPGESIPFALDWNGTLWDFHEGRFVKAEAGTYEWQLSFEGYGQCGGGSCGLHDWVKLHFTVKVN